MCKRYVSFTQIAAGTAAALVSLILPLAASAHHSPAQFRTDQVMALQGIITTFDWTNPHTYIFVDDSEGNTWRIEGNATSILRRYGWTPEALSKGDHVTVRMNPARQESRYRGRLLSVTTPDGRVLSGTAGPTARTTSTSADDNDGLQGIWVGDSGQAMDMLFAYIDHPLTEKGEIAKAGFDEAMDPIADCVTWPTPRLMAWTAFYLSEIEFDGNVAYIRNEFGETRRIIYLDRRSHPDRSRHFDQGHSVGWWEGDTLVVDSSNFSPNRSPVAAGIPSGTRKHVVERLTPGESGITLQLEILVEDPEYLAVPFEARLNWQRAAHVEFLPFECDPEISRRYAE